MPAMALIRDVPKKSHPAQTNIFADDHPIGTSSATGGFVGDPTPGSLRQDTRPLLAALIGSFRPLWVALKAVGSPMSPTEAVMDAVERYVQAPQSDLARLGRSIGGRWRARTSDLRLVRATLFQLS
jgi:hypothetical protein